MGQDDDVRSERRRKFYCHVAQSAKTDHANFLALGDTPIMHRRVRRDTGAEQRRGCAEIQVGWNTQNEAFIDDDAFGVAAIGETSEVLVWRIKRENHVRAELLEAGLALWAGSVRIDHAADRGEIAGLSLGNGRAHLGNTADNLMARDDRVVCAHELAPLVTHRMQIGMADAAKQDFDLHVAVSWIATLDFGGPQRRCRTGS